MIYKMYYTSITTLVPLTLTMRSKACQECQQCKYVDNKIIA